MNCIGHRNWLEVVQAHYGGLEAFPHAPTIRIMLGFLERDLAEEARIRVYNPTPEWTDFADPFVAEATKYANELRQWLSNRGLPR